MTEDVIPAIIIEIIHVDIYSIPFEPLICLKRVAREGSISIREENVGSVHIIIIPPTFFLADEVIPSIPVVVSHNDVG